MKEYIGQDGIPVVEYELEDIPKLISGELSWVFGLVRTQSHKEGGGSTWFRFTPEAEKVWNESKEAQEKTYWAKVEARLDAVKRMFLDTLKKSPDPAGTIADRIRQAQWKLEPDKDPTAPSELGIDPRSHLKQAWLTLKRGHREYDLSAFKFHHHQLQADIEHRFLQWLRDFQQSNKPDMIAGHAFAFTAEQPQPVQPITNPRLLAVVSDNGFQEYHDETHKYFEQWQPLLPASTNHEYRFELDTEAYKKTYFDTPHLHDATFDEGVLLRRLIKNLKPAKHPAHVSYRDYLKGLLKATDSPEPVAQASTPPQGNEGGTGAEIEPEPLEGTREAVVNILDPLQDAFITTKDFDEAVNRVCAYFDGELKQDVKPLRIKRNNWKALGKALGDIFEDIRTPDVIDRDYLQFAKDTFDCFAKHDISGGRLQGITLYKYMKHKNS